MSYIVKRQLIGKNSLMDSLVKESGTLYTKTLVFFWRTVRKKNLWLKPSSLMRLFTSKNLHAHSADASVQAFFNALSSWREHRKSDPNTKPPRKLKTYYLVTWKSSAIKIKNNNLFLSNGKHQEPLIINNWNHELPKIITLHWTGKQYELICTYSQVYEEPNIKRENAVGIDLGQINFAAISNGFIYNGRYLRSLRQWRDKKKADLNSMIEHLHKGSRRWKRLIRAKRNFLNNVANRINDILHKFTTGIILTLKNMGANTLVVGDLNGYRLNKDDGTLRNQENHQWLYGKITFMLEYKAKKHGLKCVLQEESYTSQTCPHCNHRYKPKDRNYKCPECGFVGHRDIVGAYDILRKYLGIFEKKFQVVPDMTPGLGIRYHTSNSHVACKGFVLQESTAL